MPLISPNFDVKSIIFPNFGERPFPKIAEKSPVIRTFLFLALVVLLAPFCLVK